MVSETTYMYMYLTSTELSGAERCWINDYQKMFCQEKSFQSLNFQLNLFLGDGAVVVDLPM